MSSFPNNVDLILSQINIPNKVVDVQNVVDSVDEILIKFYKNTEQLLGVTLPYDHGYVQPEAVMQSEKFILGEINVDLWGKALYSAIADTTRDTYPHYFIVQKFINYILNVYNVTDFGLTINFFSKLVNFHPPERPGMRDYYSRLLVTDYYINLRDKCVEEQNLFLCLIDGITLCLKSKDNLDESSDWQVPSETETIAQQAGELLRYLNENRTGNVSSLCQSHLNKKRMIFFDDLKPSDKLRRCLICFKFVYDIIEKDFIYWMHTKGMNRPSFDKNTRPLLSCLIWRDPRDIGLLNNLVKMILDIHQQLHCLKLPEALVVNKLVTILAELIRCSDHIHDPVYPFLGSNSNALARELSLHLSERQKLQESVHFSIAKFTTHLKPPWLRLLVCCHLLTNITGNPCSPELRCVSEILEHIEEILADSRERKLRVQRKPKVQADLKLIERFRKLKSVNSKLISGATRLHIACRQGKVEDVRALLTFSELDVNITDYNGFTPLHEAAFKGHEACVQELLELRPALGDVQRPVDTRARGTESYTPLMCAVVQGHAGVCRMLLEHTGSVLLEDVSDNNETPLELSPSAEVTEVLRHYKTNMLVTEHSKKKMHFSADKVDVVFDLCIQMIGAYFSTHKTWDVYHAMKRGPSKQQQAPGFVKFDYFRYHRDIKTNLNKLRTMVSKLKDLKIDVNEFNISLEPLKCILSLNKRQ